MATSVDAKLLKATKFPPEFNQKVDMQKVNVEVMKKWIAGKISEILGNEDDVVIELCFNLIEGTRFPDIKKLQIQLTGFLDKDTPKFCKELWLLCLSAQSNPQGVPKELLEAKKLELIQEKIESDKAAEAARLRREDEQRRERDTNNIRQRERGERGRGGGRGGGDNWRGGRGRDFDRGGGRGFERRNKRYSRSPPPRRRDSRERDLFRAPRDFDSYVPRGRGARRQGDRYRERKSASRSVSPSVSRSRSRSDSPPRRRRRSSTGSRSPTPRRRRSPSPPRGADTYRGQGNRSRRRRARTPDLRDSRPRRRTPSSSGGSLSRSPRPSKRRRSSTPRSQSPPRRQRTLGRHDSSSRSRSISPSRSPTPEPRSKGRAASRDDGDGKGDDREKHRLTRSRSRSVTPPRRRHRSPSRSRSRSRSRDGGRDRKRRRRSIERYEPARRRNTSSVSSPVDKRPRKADTEDESVRGSPRREMEATKLAEEAASPNETRDPQKEASELRERLLKEKIKKMRTKSTESVNA